MCVNCQPGIKFSDTRNGSQAKQLFVSWIKYGQEIPAPELAVCLLSTMYQILGDSQCVTNQAVICELEPTWPRDSNARAYCCQLSTTCQILGDSQCIANDTTVCELDTMYFGTVIKLNFNHSRIRNFTPKREPNRYNNFEQMRSYYITTGIKPAMHHRWPPWLGRNVPSSQWCWRPDTRFLLGSRSDIHPLKSLKWCLLVLSPPAEDYRA